MPKIVVLLLGWAAIALPGEVTAQTPGPIVIKFSHVVAPETPKGRAVDYFKQVVESRTKGRVKVEVYPNSQLYGDANELAALQKGAVQMLAPTLGKLGTSTLPDFEAFDLPYLFDSDAALHRVTQGPVGQALLKKLEPWGLVGLAYWDNGFKQLSANTPLRTPADVKGLKMRVQPSKVLEAQMRALGAVPKPMAFSEAYQALKKGQVDGTENPVSNFYTQRMFDVQKTLTLTDHGYLGYAVIANKRFWDGLPPDLRTLLEQAMADTTRFANDIANRDNNDALDALRKAGTVQIISLTPQEKAAWKRALVKVHQEMAPVVGRDLLHTLHQETGFEAGK